MNGVEFVQAIRREVLPVLEPLGFRLETSVSGRMYSAEFVTPTHVVSISYEPGDDYFLVLVFTVIDGKRSDIDDVARTPRLNNLNQRYLGPEGAAKLRLALGERESPDPLLRKIRKAAAELAVVLPRHLEHAGSHRG